MFSYSVNLVKHCSKRVVKLPLGWNLGLFRKLGRLVPCSIPFEGREECAKATAFQPGTSDKGPQYTEKSAEMVSKGDALCP